MQNVKIAYALSFLWRSWFWLGVWVFYYLRFTDYAGIGFLEAVMITTSTLGEIPTGTIADILGKKKAVILAFVLGAAGNLLMAFAPHYWVLIASIITMTLGGAFYSGSLEALVYDSLKEQGREGDFQKILGRMNSMQNAGMAVAGITGGYLYQLHTSLPFVLVAVAYCVGLVLSLGLSEPIIDSEKYSWRKFVSQNKVGFNQLFPSRKITFMVLMFIVPSAFMVATENVLNDATAIELGYNSVQFGIFATSLYLFGIIISEKSDWIIKSVGSKYIYGSIITIYVATLILIPSVAIVAGTTLLLLRYGVQTIFDNYQSVRINTVIESKYRATSLSTFNLMRNMPYVFGATGIGVLMNVYTAKGFSVYFGLALLGSIGVIYFTRLLFKRS